jgi:16S rRNA (guanine527-N7)-methyltransferase
MKPELDVTLVDSTGKKVAFMRHAIAKLQLGDGVRVQQARARGAPVKEGLPRVEVAISRAVLAAAKWLKLGLAYVVPAGRVIAMLARVDDAALSQAAAEVGAIVLSVRRYELPFSGAPRAVAVFRRRE